MTDLADDGLRPLVAMPKKASVSMEKILWPAAILIGAVLIGLALRRTPSFNLTAQTDILVLNPMLAAVRPLPEWRLKGALIFDGYEGRPGKSHSQIPAKPSSLPTPRFTGIVQPTRDARITFRRIGDGPLRILLEAEGDSEPVAELQSDEGADRTILNRMTIVLDQLEQAKQVDRSIVLQFEGHPIVGTIAGPVAGAETPILRSATLAMVGRAILTGRPYQAEAFVFGYGDALVPSGDEGAVGFVTVTHDPGFTAIARFAAPGATLHRYGAEPSAIGMSLWNRLVRDPELQIAVAIVAALIAIPKAVANIREFWGYSLRLFDQAK